MVDATRRGLLGAGAGGLAAASVLSTARPASFGNPDAPEQGAINATNPASLRDPATIAKFSTDKPETLAAVIG